MGFFDEFKEDLSQAVDEINTAGANGNPDGDPVPETTADSAEVPVDLTFEADLPEAAEEGVQESLNLSEMMEKEPEVPEETPEFSFEVKPGEADMTFEAEPAPISESVMEAAEGIFAEETPAEEPAAEEPVAEEPAFEEPAAEEPVMEEPVMEEPVMEEPAAIEEPAAEEPAVFEEPAAAEEPVAEEPVFEEAAPAEEPAFEEPEATEEEPVTGETVPEEPVMEEPGSVEESTEEPVFDTDINNTTDKENEEMSDEIINAPALPELEDGPEADENGSVTAGMTINGDITSQGSLDVVGTVKGNINVRGKLNVSGSITGNSKAAEVFADSAKINGEVISNGAVKVGQESVIIGNITATSAVIAGAVKGDIDVRGPVILDTSAIVMGDIKSKSVQINNGAVVEGHCSQCYAEVSPTSFFDELRSAVEAR